MKRYRIVIGCIALGLGLSLWFIVHSDVRMTATQPFSIAIDAELPSVLPRLGKDQGAVQYWMTGQGEQVFQALRVVSTRQGRSVLSITLHGDAPASRLYKSTTLMAIRHISRFARSERRWTQESGLSHWMAKLSPRREIVGRYVVYEATSLDGLESRPTRYAWANDDADLRFAWRVLELSRSIWMVEFIRYFSLSIQEPDHELKSRGDRTVHAKSTNLIYTHIHRWLEESPDLAIVFPRLLRQGKVDVRSSLGTDQ